MSTTQFPITDAPSCLGHQYIIGLSGGAQLSDHDKRILSSLRPLGIILGADNFAKECTYEVWIEKLGALLRDIREYAERSEMMISLDHEGAFLLGLPHR